MIYVDSNALVYLLHDVKPRSDLVVDILSSSDEVYTSLRTIEEVSYILVKVYLSRRYGIRGVHGVREFVRRKGLSLVREELRTFRSLVKEYGIVVLRDDASVDEIHEVMVRYSLLPGDAIIALTCRHYGIDAILTFDEDFRRVPWLRIVP